MKVVLSALSLAATVAIVIGCRPPSQPALSEETNKKYDEATLKQLKDSGDKLSKARPVDFYFYFPSKDKAKQASQAAAKLSYDATVEDESHGYETSVIFSKVLIPGRTAVLKCRQELVPFATRFGGRYDGWGCNVVQ